MGLAYWPGGTTEAWGNVTSELNPCSSSESGTEVRIHAAQCGGLDQWSAPPN